MHTLAYFLFWHLCDPLPRIDDVWCVPCRGAVWWFGGTRYSARWVATKIEHLVTVAYEDLKMWDVAVPRLKALLAQECTPLKRGGWWDKLALHLERHLGTSINRRSS